MTTDHTHAHTLAPSGTATVVLDIGGTIGALIVHTTADELEREIEISSVDRPTEPRTHSAVRARIIGVDIRYCAVYPQVAEGTYTIWHDGEHPAGRLAIRGGQITEYRWPDDGAVPTRRT